MTTNATPGPVEVELKPCPFCGGEAAIRTVRLPMLADCDDICVYCTDCDVDGPHMLFDQNEQGADDIPELEAEAITAWNTRIEAARPVSGEPVGYIIADMLNRKSEFKRNGIVMTAAPQGMSTLPLYAARPVQSELVEALRALESANDRVCGARPQKVYDAMIAAGMSDALSELDEARRNARDLIRALLTKATGEGL